jgi:uncharacterized protein (DUF1810 family)
VAEADSLERFVEAQASVYDGALDEIRSGAKRNHWMWFIFPQLKGLGRSATAQYYGIRSADEAAAYLRHPLLGARYLECVRALQALPNPDARSVFGAVDAMKLRSSLTLFDAVQPSLLFTDTIARWFGGEPDPATLDLLGLRAS